MRADPWVTPWRCSLCHRNHPGPCSCPCHSPAQVRAAGIAVAGVKVVTGRAPSNLPGYPSLLRLGQVRWRPGKQGRS